VAEVESPSSLPSWPITSTTATPGVVVCRLDDRLFFANAGYVKGRMREALHAAPSSPHALLLDAEGVSHVDSAGLEALADLARRLPVEVFVARAKAPVRAQLADVLPEDRFHPTVRAAVAAALRSEELDDGGVVAVAFVLAGAAAAFVLSPVAFEGAGFHERERSTLVANGHHHH
jgi:anti-anti-sigma regulatory factor